AGGGDGAGKPHDRQLLRRPGPLGRERRDRLAALSAAAAVAALFGLLPAPSPQGLLRLADERHRRPHPGRYRKGSSALPLSGGHGRLPREPLRRLWHQLDTESLVARGWSESDVDESAQAQPAGLGPAVTTRARPGKRCQLALLRRRGLPGALLRAAAAFTEG